MFVADSATAIVGSMNLAPGSFDSRREIGIQTRDSAVVERLEKDRAPRLETLARKACSSGRSA
jgi:phosphatidylserine/phosphatidylglycerophosphate/cardiolipin synthase-like enzyme